MANSNDISGVREYPFTNSRSGRTEWMTWQEMRASDVVFFAQGSKPGRARVRVAS